MLRSSEVSLSRGSKLLGLLFRRAEDLTLGMIGRRKRYSDEADLQSHVSRDGGFTALLLWNLKTSAGKVATLALPTFCACYLPYGFGLKDPPPRQDIPQGQESFASNTKATFLLGSRGRASVGVDIVHHCNS